MLINNIDAIIGNINNTLKNISSISANISNISDILIFLISQIDKEIINKNIEYIEKNNRGSKLIGK